MAGLWHCSNLNRDSHGITGYSWFYRCPNDSMVGRWCCCRRAYGNSPTSALNETAKWLYVNQGVLGGVHG